MKKVHTLYQRFILTTVLLVLCFTLAAQDRSVFRARAQENQSRQLRLTLTTSDTISLEGMGTIYSLSIDATIHQPKEGSFTRIVLEDINGHDYLVAESDWFRNDTTTVTLEHFCEETALLDGVVPLRLKCYMSGEATSTLNGIHISSQPSMRKSGDAVDSKEIIKKAQVRDIVDRINAYNKIHGRLWEASLTWVSMLPFDEKKHEINVSCDTYLNNMQYYSGGLYEIGVPCTRNYRVPSPFVASFDWRNRHSKKWLTSVKDQMSSGYCTAFAAIGMLESNIFLNYNDTSNLDLSEQYVASYGGVSFSDGAPRGRPIEFLKTDGTIDDDSMPFVNSANYVPPTNRPQGNEHVYLNDYYALSLNTLSMDSLKKYIIGKGPGVCGYQRATPYTHHRTGGHAMTLVGYGIIVPDTTYVFFNGNRPEEQFHEGDSIIGHTYWIYKNSWGQSWGHNGYMYIVYYNDDNWYMGDYAYFPKGMPISNKSRNILCLDEDGDGYYNWGIGNKPPLCPAWAPDLSDGDDSDRAKGHMNEYGFCEELSLDRPMYQYISNDSTLIQPENRTSYLGVLRGATVTLQAQQVFANGTQLLLDNGATLIINGVTISGSYLRPYPGSKIFLNNGAKIQKPFEVPLGVELIINRGSIE